MLFAVKTQKRASLVSANGPFTGLRQIDRTLSTESNDDESNEEKMII
jgi:hypothetical protein